MTTKTMTDVPISSAIVSRSAGASGIFLVCEHASNHIPESYNNLGLSAPDLRSHIAWDPGAYGVALHLSELLDAPLVAGGISRLVYDCNRPPEAAGAMPARSETYDIPGNANLSQADKSARIADVYTPFKDTLAETLANSKASVLITVHSFTPIFQGQSRSVEIGVLHDQDSRLADAILACAKAHTDLKVLRNAPYGPEDGVTHTLREHGVKQGLHNVMLEIRSDLIATPQEQASMAQMLAALLLDAVAATQAEAST